MEASRLSELVHRILQSHDRLNIGDLLSALQSALKDYANSPNPETASRFSQSLRDVEAALAQDVDQDLQPIEKRQLEKIGAISHMGNRLAVVLRALATGQPTPNDASEAIAPVLKEYRLFIEDLRALKKSFARLAIEPHHVPEGEAEVSVLLPEADVELSVDRLTELTKKWARVVGQVQEIVVGDHRPIRVVSAETGSIILTIGTCLGVGIAFFKLCTEALTAYEKLLGVRKLRRELEDSGINRQAIDAVADGETQLLNDLIAEIVDAFFKEYSKVEESGRQNELKNGLTSSLTFVIKQIDDGAEVQVLLGAPPVEPDDDVEESEGNSDQVVPGEHDASLRELKRTAAERWNGLEREDNPVLALPEPELDEMSGSDQASNVR